MKMKAIIVDDEKSCREILGRILSANHPEIEVIAEAASVAEAIVLIKHLKPGLVFLDVQLQDGLGFDVLEQVEIKDFKTIFVTAHDSYAIRAFRFNALDYILKPVAPVQVAEAIQKIKTETFQFDDLEERFKALLDNRRNEIKKIALPALEGITMLNISDIIHCVSEGSYTVFHTLNGRSVMVSRPIKEYDELLAPYNFFRVHQSHLVNLNFVAKFLKEDNGLLVLEDGSRIEVARRRKELLMQVLLSLKA